MTANVNDMPNRLALHNDMTIGFRFGHMHSMTPINLPGDGHHPVVKVRFRGGLTLDFDPSTAAELARRLPEALASLPGFRQGNIA
jgi:hypothetical protein